ncbi:hypothetical protein B0T22DRAFT_169453 [Podospora appendiculata]|uniref:GLEYA adhesin domain-containing protein n=1 Tax=Podospora appendiculata TaxID=314037 RepID=A0AAE0XB22_9PEZI|nr:hypothetical protein B0T22DRAFT_169453 [Podospora appendiculata]
MKQTLFLLPGFAWLAAAGGCCRTNQCLRAVIADTFSASQRIQDCSSNLAFTVTPAAVTVTATVTEAGPAESVTVVETEYVTMDKTVTVATETVRFTKSETSIAATETVLFTESQLTTASTATLLFGASSTVIGFTQTNQITTIQTVTAATQTQFNTVTTVTNAVLKAREAETVPAYAALACPSFAKYASACSCAGVLPTTITVDAPVQTATVTELSTSTITVKHSTADIKTDTALLTDTTSATFTETVLLTATTSVTLTNVVSLTATTSLTSTTIVVVTATTATTKTDLATVTATEQASATKVCAIGAKAGVFRAVATEYNNTPLLIYANMLNALTGGMNWQPASTSTSASVQNKFIFSLDSLGRLYLAYNIPPYNYVYYIYVSTATTGSIWPQVNTQTTIASSIANGGKVEYVYGCVDPVSKELTLNAAGRQSILWCGQQMWMAYGAGEDVNRGGACTKMYPKISAV